MPLFRRKDTNTDYKARLEHKLYLARESPEPDFDLSDCNLKAVPCGVFSLCKVFRKENLYLQQNQLISLTGGGKIEDLLLLQILDIHSNLLQKLPDEIVCLTNLRELNVSNNRLSHLPENIGEMTKLCILKSSNNNLNYVPMSLGNLQFLQHLDVRFNKKLSKLPSSLCRASSMKEILLDNNNFEYPPKSVVDQGTTTIMQFLCSEEGLKYVSPEYSSPDKTTSDKSEKQLQNEDDIFQAKILQLETIKEKKQRELLALEQDIFEQQMKELELQNVMKNNKDQLLKDLAQQQSLLDNEILKVQLERDTERARLVNEVQQVETAASSLIFHLLASRNLKDSLQIQALIEQESTEEQRLLNLCHEDYKSLKHKNVLCAMENLLVEEAQHAAKIREYERGKAETTRTILNQELENEKAMDRFLLSQEQGREDLLNQLQQDEELQRAAVAKLLERGDARLWGLMQHLRLVQEQLAALTALEMKRRHLEISEQMDDLSNQRIKLSELLVGLLDQQAARRKQLFETMSELERQHSEEEKLKVENFWLVQYQRLLDLRSAVLIDQECSLDPLLAQHLLREGVVHCLPLLTDWVLNPSTLDQLSHDDLLQAGISSFDTRQRILEAVISYLEEQAQRELNLAALASTSQAPSAPPKTDVELVSSFGATECVICMDNECEVIFVPCGHLCSCLKCSESVEDCPICRARISQKIRIIVP